MKRVLCVVLVGVLVGLAARTHASPRDGLVLEGTLNLNQATAEELMLLPGIGPAKARRILEWRAKHTFRRVEDLTRVKGFGKKTLMRLRPFLAVAGPTTLRRVPRDLRAPLPSSPEGTSLRPASPDPRMVQAPDGGRPTPRP